MYKLIIKIFDNKNIIFLLSSYPIFNFLIINYDKISLNLFFLILFIFINILFFNLILIKFKLTYFLYLFNFIIFYIFIYGYYLNTIDKIETWQNIEIKYYNNIYYIFFIVFFIFISIFKNYKFFKFFINYLVLSSLIALVFEIGNIDYTKFLNNTKDTYKFKNYKFNNFENDFVILFFDEYGRADILKKYYQYDNYQFQKELEQLGFEIENEAISHTTATDIYVPSLLTLDLEYKGNSAWNMGALNTPPLFKFFSTNKYNLIYNGHCNKYTNEKYLFKEYGNTNICDNNYHSTHIIIDKKNKFLNIIPNYLIFDFLPLITITRAGGFFTRYLLDDTRETYAVGDINVFNEKIEKSYLDSFKGKKFIYSFSSQPHRPFYYDENCNKNKVFEIIDTLKNVDDERDRLYVNQLKCINSNILNLVSKFNKYLNDPIIIILSDHGPRFRQKSDDEKKFSFFAIKKPDKFCSNYKSESSQTIDLIKAIIKCL